MAPRKRRGAPPGGAVSDANGLFSLQLERQILMQNQMRERQAAMQLAWSREFLKYFGAFFAVAAFGLTAG